MKSHNKFKPATFSGILIVSVSLLAVAHENHHKAHHQQNTVTVKTKTALQEINELYLKDVKPIFQNKCFDCHSSQARLPWYSKIPGAKQLIQSDMDEAKEHLDMETDFPFKSHASPVEDLEAIDKSIQKNEMPPFRYRLMHSESLLTEEEKEKVQQWVQFGKEKLKEKSN